MNPYQLPLSFDDAESASNNRKKGVEVQTPKTPTKIQKTYLHPDVVEKYRFNGECDDPRLKGILHRLASGEKLTSPERAKRLSQSLEEGVETVETTVSSFKVIIDGLKCLSYQPTRAIYLEMEEKIESHLKLLENGIERLLKIYNKHVSIPAGSKPSQWQKENSQEMKVLVQELIYFEHYFTKQVHFSVMDFEQTPHLSAYFQRTERYLDYLPGCCRRLASLVRQGIFDKVPGHQSDDV